MGEICMGYLPMQMTYEQYFSAATTISMVGIYTFWGGGMITNLVLGISRVLHSKPTLKGHD